jgi:hypothetical protein
MNLTWIPSKDVHDLNKHANHLSFMSQLKTLLTIVQVSLATIGMAAIPTFWQSISDAEIHEDSLLRHYYQQLLHHPATKNLTVIELNINVLQEKTMNLLLDGHLVTVHQVSFENTDVNQNSVFNNPNSFQIWFGASEQTASFGKRPDFYFTVRGDKVAGKFFHNNIPYSLIPIYKNYHVLIEHHPTQLSDVCASSNDNSFFEEGVKRFKTADIASNNQDYTLRVLVALSQAALGQLRTYSATYSANHFAENAVQESNLAYLRGEIPFRLQMEAVTFLSYSEAEMPRDLNNLASEKPPFDQIKQMRTQYATDIQVLIRSNEAPIAGLSMKKETGVSSGKAFCLMSADGIAFTPFALKHQVEHLVKGWLPTDEVSRRTASLSAIRSNVRQSNLPFWQYHAFARHLKWYSDAQDLELSMEMDTVTRIAEVAHTENGIVLPHWDLNVLEKPIKIEKNSLFSIHNLHENKMDPFDGIPIKVKPNPTAGKTVVEYAIAADKQNVTMRISTLTGQFIQFLVDDGEHPLGQYAIQWDAGWLPNGVYLCTLRAGGQTRTTRIVVSH